MSRTISEIQESIFKTKASLEDLNGLTSTSKTALWRLWVYIMAFCIYTLERLFDTHSIAVTKVLSEQKAHTPAWYRKQALDFQFGFTFDENIGIFDNENATTEQIEASRIIKYCAVNESDDESTLIVKIAGETDGVLNPITTEHITAFTAYMKRVRDGGVKVNVINYPADYLKLSLKIEYDPLVLDANGMNQRTGAFPVNNALNEFLKELPFNGELILAKLVDKLQLIEGVRIPTINAAWSKWIDKDQLDVYVEYSEIQIKRIPESGYFKLDLDTTIDYVAQS
ncbi:nucleotidyltransferase [Empedobacter brevis]|uniref:nucleotidyltransferase n=1 Tax=Empedobacter brevis TaxID=247 RepID=UPI002897B3A8|nr:nucleotidyltransferase [Empedobacter brevis]